MFTGIITAVSKIKKASKTDAGLLLTLEKPETWTDLEIGESIATNGVCLTVTEIHESEYDCLLIPESLEKSSFGKEIPESVNLERSLKLNDRLSGHFVQGHVDTTAQVLEIKNGHDVQISFRLPVNFKNLVVSKGSISINGVSLTIASLSPDSFGVALIPHTLKHTTFGNLKAGDRVNLEFDIIGKYILRSLQNAAG